MHRTIPTRQVYRQLVWHGFTGITLTLWSIYALLTAPAVQPPTALFALVAFTTGMYAFHRALRLWRRWHWQGLTRWERNVLAELAERRAAAEGAR